MKKKFLVLLAGGVVATILLAGFRQWRCYKEATRSLSMVERVTPGTEINGVKELLEKDFSIENCPPNGTCTLTKSFNSARLETLMSRKSLIFVVEISAEGGVVTNTNVSMKVVSSDNWIGAAVLRSQHTECKNPESSCTSIVVTDNRRVPARIVSRLTADPLPEVKQPAYDFELKCLLPFRGCATIDDIYPGWKQLPEIPAVVTSRR